jgi:LPS sulfotransferase NodH
MISPIWILCTLRSGSSHLAVFLDAFVGFGQFQEWFNFAIGTQLYDNHYYHNNDNQIVGLPKYAKVPRCQFEKLFEDSNRGQIEAVLPGLKYIYLTRKDLVEQAVSNYFANITCKWNFIDKKELEEYKSRRVPYNKSYMIMMYRHTKEYAAKWNNYLKEVDSFHIDYSELKDVVKLDSLLRFLNIEHTKQKITDALNGIQYMKIERPETKEYVSKLRKLIYENPESVTSSMVGRKVFS